MAASSGYRSRIQQYQRAVADQAPQPAFSAPPSSAPPSSAPPSSTPPSDATATQNAVFAAMRARGQQMQVTAPPPAFGPAAPTMGSTYGNPGLVFDPFSGHFHMGAARPAISPGTAAAINQTSPGALPGSWPLNNDQAAAVQMDPQGGWTDPRTAKRYNNVRPIEGGLGFAAEDSTGTTVIIDQSGNVTTPAHAQGNAPGATYYLPRGEARIDYGLMTPGGMPNLPLYNTMPAPVGQSSQYGGFGSHYGGGGGGGGGGGNLRRYLDSLALVNWSIG